MEQDLKKTKRRSKDSVFVRLFENTEYLLRLYRDLHPEDTDVTEEDISVKTLESVFVNSLYNDLGFAVRDKLIFLVEAQSTWNVNITFRIFIYLAETYQRYVSDTGQSVHGTSKLKLPIPELYVVYSGDREIPDEVSLSEDFFGGKAPVDIRVRVLRSTDTDTIFGQYIGFCREYDEQRKIYSSSIECARKTIRVCIEKGYLTEFLKKNESEVISMLSLLFDEDYLREQYNKSLRKEYKEKYMEKGMKKGMEKGMEKGAAAREAEIIERLKAHGMTDKQIKELIFDN